MTFRAFPRFVLKNLDLSKTVPRRFRESLDILSEGLMIVGVDGRILLANQALADITGNDPRQDDWHLGVPTGLRQRPMKPRAFRGIGHWRRKGH